MIPIKELIDVRYPSPSLYNVPETHHPAITIPNPKNNPPTIVDNPTGKTLASDGTPPKAGIAVIQCIIAVKPILETINPTIMPFILVPLPKRNKSRNPEAKQKRLRCNTKPATFDKSQIAANC